MSVPANHSAASKESAYTPEQWDEFTRAEETKQFRQLRLKHDMHVEEIKKKFAAVVSGETVLTFAYVDELRDGMLRLYQLAAVYEHTSTKVSEKWLAMAGEINSAVSLSVSDAQTTLKRVLTWAKRVDGGHSEKQ